MHGAPPAGEGINILPPSALTAASVTFQIGDGMKLIGIIGLCAAFSLASATAAEFYRYSDPHGNVIFTDDLSKVPADQRSNAEMVVNTRQAPSSVLAPKKPQGKAVASQKHDAPSLKNEREQLEAVKRELDREFKSLAEENAELREEQRAALAPDQIKAVNKKVVRFNTRFQAYQEKEAAYKSRREMFNRRVNETTSGSNQ